MEPENMHMKIEGKKVAFNLDIHKHLVQELKIVFKKDGVYIISVDPAHIAMVATVLKNIACEEYNINETGELTIGIDLSKIRDFLKIGKPSDIFIFDYDSENHRLVVRLGNLVRTMGLLDTAGMPDPEIPRLILTNKATLETKTLHANIRAIMPEKKTRWSTCGKMTINNESMVLEKHDSEETEETQKAVLDKSHLIALVSGNDSGLIFTVDKVEEQLREFKRSFSQVTLETNGSNHPLKITANNDDMSVEYMLAPIIEQEERQETVEPNQELEPEAEIRTENIPEVEPEPEIEPELPEIIPPLEQTPEVNTPEPTMVICKPKRQPYEKHQWTIDMESVRDAIERCCSTSHTGEIARCNGFVFFIVSPRRTTSDNRRGERIVQKNLPQDHVLLAWYRYLPRRWIVQTVRKA